MTPSATRRPGRDPDGAAVYAVGIAVERIPVYCAAFGVPDQFTPIGGISIGYSDDPPRDFSHERKPMADTVHKGRWGQPG